MIAAVKEDYNTLLTNSSVIRMGSDIQIKVVNFSETT